MTQPNKMHRTYQNEQHEGQLWHASTWKQHTAKGREGDGKWDQETIMTQPKKWHRTYQNDQHEGQLWHSSTWKQHTANRREEEGKGDQYAIVTQPKKWHRTYQNDQHEGQLGHSSTGKLGTAQGGDGRRPRNHYHTTEQIVIDSTKWTTWRACVVISNKKIVNNKEWRVWWNQKTNQFADANLQKYVALQIM